MQNARVAIELYRSASDTDAQVSRHLLPSPLLALQEQKLGQEESLGTIFDTLRRFLSWQVQG